MGRARLHRVMLAIDGGVTMLNVVLRFVIYLTMSYVINIE